MYIEAFVTIYDLVLGQNLQIYYALPKFSIQMLHKTMIEKNSMRIMSHLETGGEKKRLAQHVCLKMNSNSIFPYNWLQVMRLEL